MTENLFVSHPTVDVESDDPQQHLVAASDESALKKILLIYERRERWVSGAVERGFQIDTAEEASHWLLGQTQIDATADLLREEFGRDAVLPLEIDELS